MKRTVALIGNPNSGKTTLFNKLTKLHQTVGNWTGVTIEKKEGFYYRDKEIEIVDLPGIYSLTPYSPEEKIARDFILDAHPDLVINIIDSTNLERNLYLTLQLLETGVKVVLALNLADELAASGIEIDIEKLTELTGADAVSVSALKGHNIDKLMQTVKRVIENPPKKYKHMTFDADIEKAVQEIGGLLDVNRFLAIKAFERDTLAVQRYAKGAKAERLNAVIEPLEKAEKENSAAVISDARYRFLSKEIPLLQSSKINKRARLTEKIDKIVLNKYLAFPIFIAVIWLMYFISIQLLGSLGKRGMEFLMEKLSRQAALGLVKIGAPWWLIGLTVNGIIMGVGTMLTFLPQVLILFFFISMLEGCGYMARVALIMDRIFKKIGLSGKSFIPMIIGCGCSVPAVMTARTIENEDDRRMTVMLVPFVPCSAKLPVFALFVGAFFPSNPFVAPSMYLLGITMVIIGGYLLKKLKIFRTSSDTFLLELPLYRAPTPRNVLTEMWEKAKAFLIKVGTIIFIASIVIWALQSFNWKLQEATPDESLLASIGTILAPIFKPLGFGDWRATVALLVGTAAKENVVSTLSILFGANGNMLASSLGEVFTPLSAYSYMAFVLLSFPCIAALGAIKKEMGSTKWLITAMAFQFITAYTVSFLIYNLGSLFIYNYWIIVAPAIALTVSFIAYIMVRKKFKK